MKALVLSGGSVKGAFQAGAIYGVLASGFKPDLICGISVGSLNATFLAHQAAKYLDLNGTFFWDTIGSELNDLWTREVTGPDSLVKKDLFTKAGNVFEAITGQFNGLLDNDPMKGLVQRNIDFEVLKTAPFQVNIGAVNLHTSKIEYKSPLEANYFQHLMASTAIPVILPGETMNGHFFLDGGMRDVAPLKHAIQQGADEIVVITCHCENLPVAGHDFRSGNVFQYFERLMDVVVNELVNNDLADAYFYNDLIQDAQEKQVTLKCLEDKKHLNLTVIRPEEALQVDIQDFSSTEIAQMLNDGYRLAKEKYPPRP